MLKNLHISLADIRIAYIVHTGKEMDRFMAFFDAATQVRKEMNNDKKFDALIDACIAVRAEDNIGSCPTPYTELAERVKARLFPVTNFLAMGPHCWGKATTREQAVKNAKQNWPRSFSTVKRPSDKHFSIYTSTGVFTVDGIGNIHSTVDDIVKVQTSCLATA